MVCSSEEKEAVLAQLEIAEEWIYEDGSHAGLVVYQDKLAELERLTDPIHFRHVEVERRPLALEKCREALVHVRARVHN